MTEVVSRDVLIDANVPVEWVRVVGRHRHELGDLASLVASIEDVGLLNPITVTRDGRLIAGQRRLEACRLLDWDTVPVRFVDSLDDAAKLLHAERDENTCRKDMLPSELAALGAALYEIEANTARERQGTRTDLGVQLHGMRTRKLEGSSGVTTVSVVGPALGMAGRTYSELYYAHKVATDPDLPDSERALGREALNEMDRTGAIAPPARRLRAKIRAKREAQEVKTAALAAPIEHESAPVGARTKVAAERFARIRELAGSGHTSHQIAEILGYSSAAGVRETARQQKIAIPADVAMGKSHRRIDSNRIVRETAQALDGLLMGVDLVRLEDLDRVEAATWATSLTDSLRILNRFAKQIKEITQ